MNTNSFRNSAAAILAILETHGISNPGKWSNICMRNVRHTLELIGVAPEAYLRVKRADIQPNKGEIPLPDGMRYLYEVSLLNQDDKIVNPSYRGSSMKYRSDDFFSRNWWNRPSKSNNPVLGIQEGSCLFFLEGDPTNYKCAYLSYTSLERDCEGNIVYPFYCDFAVSMGLDYAITHAKFRQGAKISAQNLQDTRNAWHEAIGDAKGEIKMPGISELYSMIYQLHANPLASKTMPKRIYN